MIKNIAKFLFFSLFILIPITVKAVPATPYPINLTLPDGSELSIYLKGDEFFNYKTTLDGYLIRESDDGYYQYAKQDASGNIILTGTRANQIEKRTAEEKKLLQTLQANSDFSTINQQQRATKVSALTNNEGMQKAYPKTGSPKSIVILVNFKDVAFVVSNPQTAFTNLLNEAGYSSNGGTGSARDYFKVSSNNVSSPDFVVVGPYTLPQNRSYYGANDSNGDDVKPRQMVADACNAAASAGVDFSSYDTDYDGVVDNVFVYYAGNNEAEGGADDTVWPHRWYLSTPLMLNGKAISGYACTSELKGSSGSGMCGIGTFCHEFGHVYGLADYYATDGSTHHTLSYWNIMDAGAYLNSGRTPPTYSAYDRFSLGWLTPTILKSAVDVTLPELQSSNKAYIITQSGTHNLSGSNPNPVEFFTLENRQKTGWDAYLPRSGMLITRIYYNATSWRNNTPNNIASSMGVDIMEADGDGSDGASSLAGDPFPGSKNVTGYNPVLRSGDNINRPLTEIKETAGVINFRFMGGGNKPIIKNDLSKLVAFSTVFGTPSETQKFGISATLLKGNVFIDFNFKSHFEIKREDQPNAPWSKTLELPASGTILDSTVILIRYNPAEPSYTEIHFDYLNIKSEDADTQQATLEGTSTRQIYVVPPVAVQPESVTLKGFTASWNAVYDASGYYLTMFNIVDGTSVLKEGFDNGLKPSPGWKINAESLMTLSNFAGDSIPAIQMKSTGDYILSEKYIFPVTGLSFFIRSVAENTGSVNIEAYNGSTWTLIESIPVINTLNKKAGYVFTEDKNYIQFKISFTKGTASVSVDDVAVLFPRNIIYKVLNQWTPTNSAFIEMILPGKEYFFTVRASDKTLYPDNSIKYENITAYSNIISFDVNEDVNQHFSKNNLISIYKDASGFAVLNLTDYPSVEDRNIYVYMVDGKLLTKIEAKGNIITLDNLIKGQAYILKIGSSTIRVIL